MCRVLFSQEDVHLHPYAEQYFIVNKLFWESWVKFKINTSPYICTPKAYCIFDMCTVWMRHNLVTSFISKQSQVYTQANTHGEVAKIQPPGDALYFIIEQKWVRHPRFLSYKILNQSLWQRHQFYREINYHLCILWLSICIVQNFKK